MPRGGVRQGTPGVAYVNRTDLNRNRQPVQAATGQPYGVAGAQKDAQRQIPLPATPDVPVPPPLTAPSERPAEPVTAGLSTGPGEGRFVPGPEPLDVGMQLRAIMSRFPTRELAELIDLLGEQ